jgi:hypothetical protein
VTAKGVFVLLLTCSLGASCTGGKPFLLQGNADTAQVGYSGNLDAATPVARRHCAQYERVPRFLEAEENIAFFDCVRP